MLYFNMGIQVVNLPFLYTINSLEHSHSSLVIYEKKVMILIAGQGGIGYYFWVVSRRGNLNGQ
jgi:hypothetical protein